MNIFGLLFTNLAQGAMTLRFPDRPPPAAAFRGLVQINEKTCEGCAMCAFVCTSRSIVFQNAETTYDWSYDPGQCTFCGRCVEICTSKSLTMQPKPPPIYTTSGALKIAYRIKRKPPPGSEPPADPAPSGAGGDPSKEATP